MENSAETIRQIPFFSGLRREDLARVAGKLEEERFSSGQVIFCQDEDGEAMYVVGSGAVEVILEKDGVRVESLGVLGPYECFGEMSLLTGEKRSATAIALVETTVLKLRKDAWDELLSKHPSLSLHLCKLLSRRLVERHREVLKDPEAVKLVMEEFFSAQPFHIQDFLLKTSILKSLDPRAIQSVLSISDSSDILAALSRNHPALVRRNGNYEYLEYLREFLSSKLGRAERDELHRRFAAYFFSQGRWALAINHYLNAEAWKEALQHLDDHGEELLDSEPPKEVLHWIETLPRDISRTHGHLVRLKAEAHARLGDLDAALRTYQEFLAQSQFSAAETSEIPRYYQELAELHRRKGEIGEALSSLRMGISALEEGSTGTHAIQALCSIELLQRRKGLQEAALQWSVRALHVAQKLKGQTRGLLSQNSKWLGLIVAIVVGAGLWQLPPPSSLDEKGMHFLATLAAAVMLWMFDVVDQYIVALLLLLIWLLFGVVPSGMAVAGFSNGSWFFILGVLGIGAAVNKSGLIYRVALQVLRCVRPDYKMYTFVLAATGLVLTPLVPETRGRVSITAPISQSISEFMGFKPRSNGSAGLVLSGYIGFIQLTFMFLTGANYTLVGWNLLPEAARSQFGWGTWTVAALPAGIFTLLFLLAAIHLLFPLRERPAISSRTLETQLAILGPLTTGEWLSLGILALTLLGWVGKPLHGIGEPWVALGALLIFLITGVLDKNGLRSGVDWGLLLFIGVLNSLGAIIPYLKVDRWIIELINPVFAIASSQSLPFLLLVALMVYLVRLFLKHSSAVILLILSLTPFAADMGIHPGVLLITILIAIESWFLPYQSENYQIAYYATDEKAFSHGQARKLMVAKFSASFLAIAISVPYWRMMGLIH